MNNPIHTTPVLSDPTTEVIVGKEEDIESKSISRLLVIIFSTIYTIYTFSFIVDIAKSKKERRSNGKTPYLIHSIYGAIAVGT